MFLEQIAEHVREEVEARRRKAPPSALRDRPLFSQPCRGFGKSLKGESRHIIAEIKRASPSQGLIREQFDPVRLAGDFFANGASALSVLTEERFFQGSLSYLERIRQEVPLPLLRKDFVLDGYQLIEAKSFGADAILLIVALLDPALLRELQDEAASLSLDALVEVHTEAELECALKAGAALIGINNRDLKTFEVNLHTAERLLPRIPAEILVVCESGIDHPHDLARLEAVGARVFVVGESLMRAPDPGSKLKELLEGRTRTQFKMQSAK